MDINIKNTNKATAVRDLAKYLGIELAETICIGDNENDIEMIKKAGVGIAMANACDELLEVCDHVTTSNDEYGIAKAMYEYVLK